MATHNARVDQIISNLRMLTQTDRMDTRGAIYQYCGTVYDLCTGTGTIDMPTAFAQFKALAERLIGLEMLRDRLREFLSAECKWVAGSPLVQQSDEWFKGAWDHYNGIADQVASTEQQLRVIVLDILSIRK